MPDHKQSRLEQDATELNREARSLPEMKLSAAVREGMTRGKKREKRRIAFAACSMSVAVVAAMLVLLPVKDFGTAREPGQQIQITGAGSAYQLEEFPQNFMKDKSLKSAMERGLVQPLNLYAEKNGYRVELLGAIADGRKSYVLFSVHNKRDTEIILRDVKLAYGGIETPSFGAVIENLSGSGQIAPGATTYYVYASNLSTFEPYTDAADIQFSLSDTSHQALNSRSPKYVTSLDFALSLDPNMFADLERIYDVNRTLMVDGQQIHVPRLQFTPLNTYIDVEYGEANDKQIFKLLNPVLIGKSGDHIEKQYYPVVMMTEESAAYSKITLIFKPNEFDKLESTSFKVAGIAAVAKDQLKVVVDLRKGEILEAPDEKLEWIPADSEAGAGEVWFQRKLEHPRAAESFGMWLDSSFTDAEGTEHPMLSPESVSHSGYSLSVRNNAIEDNKAYNFGAEALEYPQPLTIKVNRYWIPVEETQSVELLKRGRP